MEISIVKIIHKRMRKKHFLGAVTILLFSVLIAVILRPVDNVALIIQQEKLLQCESGGIHMYCRCHSSDGKCYGGNWFSFRKKCFSGTITEPSSFVNCTKFDSVCEEQ